MPTDATEMLPPFNALYEYDLCRGCKKPLAPENYRVADGCVCNAPRGINHGIVAKATCTCKECDPAETGSTRYPALPEKQPEPPFEMKRSNFLGAPVFYELNHACRAISDAFGTCPYLVGSCLHKRDFRDVDIRLILDDDDYAKQFPDGGGWCGAKWSLLCMSISEWLKAKTGLKIDFQIQQQTEANKDYPKQPRHALGIYLTQKGSK